MLQVGFDIGGTSIKAGVVRDSRDKVDIAASRRIPFPTGDPYGAVVDLMAKLVAEMAEELKIPVSDFQSIGVAVPGTIDATGEVVINAHNLYFHDVPLKRAVEEKFPGIPVLMANDANAAALAEYYAGAFRGYGTAILITLGTGVGGGMVLNGKMWNGARNNGFELGHIIVKHGGQLCTCGNRGCLESYGTATWLKQQGRKAVVEYPLSLIYKKARGDIGNVSAKTVIDAAKENDPFAVDIFNRYVDYLSSGIASLAVLFDPEIIALGGGVSLAGEFLYEPLRKLIVRKSFYHVPVPVVPARLGNEAGVIGAAMLAKGQVS
ncbi:MAG: ROK family protein [Clostridiales Family XIII bacterium]|jgi:glucokinase|nr:ROK family protein [Clostridiales Family XIII bacterium]